MSDDRILVRVSVDLEDLVPEFLQNRREDARVIEGALERNDFELIRRLGHSMKGAGGGYGFDAITDIGRGIEEAAKATDIPRIRQGVEELVSFLDRVDVVYEEMDY